MKNLTRDEIITLIEHPVGNCISIFMCGDRGALELPTAVKQNQIKYKNILKVVKERLFISDVSPLMADSLLKSLNGLLDDEQFWQVHSHGLALFCAPDFLQYYLLPLDFNGRDLAFISNRFYIKPLLPLLSGDGLFYLLALSHNQIKFYQGTHYNISEIKLPQSVPKNIEEIMAEDARADRRLNSDDTFQDDNVDEKNDLLRYFQKVDQGLQEILKTETAPLILVGVDYLLPVYKQISSYQHITDEVIAGSPNGLKEQELHKRGWAIVAPGFLKAQQEALERYGEYAANKQASNKIDDIVKAAHQGRISILLLNPEINIRGTYDPNTNTVTISKDAAGGEDLLELVAVQTILKGGVVYIVEQKNMPRNSAVAAIYRYVVASAAASR